MEIMRRFLAALGSTVGLTILGSILLCLFFWFLGPFFAFADVRPLESLNGRLTAIAVIVALTLVLILINVLRMQSKDKSLADKITEETEGFPENSTAHSEIQEVRDRMREVFAYLQHKNKKRAWFGGSKFLYQMPWYVVIGAPGAGKTTLLRESGIPMEGEEQFGKAPFMGVSGTQNCDWWFFKDAILLDTAGRYTTQSGITAETDSVAWRGFLDLLKKFRTRQPINGAIVAVSLEPEENDDPQTRLGRARDVRARLIELRETLGVRFPVYVMFTKVDTLAGFSEYFDKSHYADHVWGFTLPYSPDESIDAVQAFDREFDDLLTELSDRTVEKMQAERNFKRRRLVGCFPAQVASVRPIAEEFLDEVFRESALDEKPLLRGVYLTSGTQGDTPIDRLRISILKTFRISGESLKPNKRTGRSYFIKNLLLKVVFREAGLVSADDKVERWYRWTQYSMVAGCVVIAMIGLGFWTNSYSKNAALIAGAQAKIDDYKKQLEKLPTGEVEDGDVARVVPALNLLRSLPGNQARGDVEPSLEMTWGLYQGDLIGADAVQSYRSALSDLLLPRILYRLEQLIIQNINEPDVLHEALKMYLMLGKRSPEGPDVELIVALMSVEWSREFDGRTQLQSDLRNHLSFMLRNPMKKIELNDPLIEQAQDVLLLTRMSKRIYEGILKSKSARDLRPFRLSDVGGPVASQVLTRPSGRDLTDGIDGIFTKKGFHSVFLEELTDVRDRTRRESWVLGSKGQIDDSPEGLAQLTQEALGLYYNDYKLHYDILLSDVDIIPMENVRQAARITNDLAGSNSPIKNMITAIANETKLILREDESAVDLTVPDTDGLVNLGERELMGRLSSRQQRVFEVLSKSNSGRGSGNNVEPDPFGADVERHFKWLHDLVDGSNGAQPKIDALQQSLSDVYRELNNISVNGNATINPDGGAVNQLLQDSEQLVGPVNRWAVQIAEGAAGITADGTRSSLHRQWRAKVYPLCNRALGNRYPFARSSKSDVALQDFQRLFAPNGAIDSFFDEHLSNFVETSADPWRWRRVNNTDLGISENVLVQFQRAAEIRDSFFIGPGLPTISFEITPDNLSEKVLRSLLEVNGQQVIYEHGAPQTTTLIWPNTRSGRTRLSYTTKDSSRKNNVDFIGPWAWFRMLDTAQIGPIVSTGEDRVIFNLGGRQASYRLRAGSSLNPFRLRALREFRCPTSL